MKRAQIVVFLCVGLLAVAPAGAFASSISCEGGIVSTGDTRVDLLTKCGEPAWKESHDEEITEHLVTGMKRTVLVTIEDWTYDFGPNQFTRIVTLKNGRVAGVKSGQYGRQREEPVVHGECSEQVVSIGVRKSDVYAKCGEPTWTDTRQEEIRERMDRGGFRKVFVTVDEWTYNLGPNRFVRVFTFRNGKLVDIRSGGYGY